MASVVVTSYNYAHLIRETLDGIAAQTFRDFEVLVVDNGSTDGSPDIIREYEARDPRFHLLQHEGGVNKGLPASVKLGARKSRGEYVAFCEADDIWMPEHLERCMALVDKSDGKVNFLITDLEPFGDPRRCAEIEEAKAVRADALSRESNRISPAEFRRFNWIFTFSVVMVRRSVLLACDMDSVPRPSNLDWWLWRQIALENDIWVVHEKLTKWRLHAMSFTVKDDNPAMIAEGYDMVAKMDRLLVERHPVSAQSLVPFLRPEDDFHCADGTLLRRDGTSVALPPSFTVVIPADDAPAAALSRTLSSLASQTYRNFETVLVVGDDAEAAMPSGLPGVRRIQSPGSHDMAAALSAAEGSSTAEWTMLLLPGDILRESSLEVMSARIVLEPTADAVFGTTLCTGVDRSVGGHSTMGGMLPCSDGLLRPFAHFGAFAVRRSPPRPSPTPTGRKPSTTCRSPELDVLSRLCGAGDPVFTDRILVLLDDGPEGRDSGAAKLRALMDSFSRVGLPVAVRHRSLPRTLGSACATLAALLRRDGLRFFVKCARFALSPSAWRWLLRPGASPSAKRNP